MTKNTAVLEESIANVLRESNDKLLLFAIPFPLSPAIRKDGEALSSFLSELREKNTLKLDLDGSLEQLKFALSTIEKNKEYQAIIINDFQAFKADPEKLNLLSQQSFDFLFANLPALSKENIAGATLVLDYLSATKSEKMKATLAKKAESGIKLGNSSFGDKRGKAVRTRKLNAFKDKSMVPLRREAYRLVEEDGWSLNRVAQYFNETGKTSPKGGSFYAKTVDRLVEMQKELYDFKTTSESARNPYKNAGYHELSALPIDNQTDQKQPNTGKKPLRIAAIQEDQNFEGTLSFSLLEPIDYPIRVLIYDHHTDQPPVYKNDFSAAETSISIDLEKAVLLPGVHYLCVIPQDDGLEFEPVLNLRIMLWNSLI